MPVKADEILSKIYQAFPDATVELKDTVGDMNHYAMELESKLFAGVGKVQQHKMVMNALGSMVGTTLHAISIKTKVKENI
jgi:stress-induced morphogen